MDNPYCSCKLNTCCGRVGALVPLHRRHHARRLAHGLRLRHHAPRAAGAAATIPMANPYCSCKLTHKTTHRAAQRRSRSARGAGASTSGTSRRSGCCPGLRPPWSGSSTRCPTRGESRKTPRCYLRNACAFPCGVHRLVSPLPFLVVLPPSKALPPFLVVSTKAFQSLSL